MNSSFPEVKNVINVNVQHKAELEVLVLSDFVKEYKKLRPVGANNTYYLIELPKPFVNGNYDPKKKYSIRLAYNKADNHKIIVIDLDDNQPILSINNRKVKLSNLNGGVQNGK